MAVTKINEKLTLVNFARGGNKKRYIVIHDVGVKGQTAKNNIDYFYKTYRGASAHYFVDKNSIWRSVSDNDIAWHIGDGKGKYGIYNSDAIGIEMIVEKDGTIAKETKENTKYLVNKLQYDYGISDKNIIRHYDASRKNCPQFLNTDGKWTKWKDFYKYLISDTIESESEDIMKFSNSTTKDAVKADVEFWVKKGYVGKDWLDKFNDNTMTYGDYLGLKNIAQNKAYK